MILKAISCAWLFFALISENKSQKTEFISIIHMAVAFYVTWSLLFGSWELPGRWELLNLTKESFMIESTGWIIFVLSIIFGMKFLIEGQDPLTYQYPRFTTSWIFKHKQVGYFLALLGSWLIAYTGGYYKIPFYFTGVVFMFSYSMNGSRQEDTEKKQAT